MNITITRRTQNYRRSVNGAWLAGSADTDTVVRPQERAVAAVFYMGLSSSAELVWEDGHREFWRHNSSNYLEGPSDSRLRKPEFRAPGSVWFPRNESGKGQWIEQEAA